MTTGRITQDKSPQWLMVSRPRGGYPCVSCVCCVCLPQKQQRTHLMQRHKPAQSLEAATVPIPRAEFSLALVTAICEQIAQGEPVSRLGAKPGMPSSSTFFAWLRQSDEAASLYSAAKRARAELARDKIAELNGKLEKGEIDPQSAKVMADNLKWLASKDAPGSYSERMEVTGEQGKDLLPARERDDLELARFCALIFSRAVRQQQEAGTEMAAGLKPLLGVMELDNDDRLAR